MTRSRISLALGSIGLLLAGTLFLLSRTESAPSPVRHSALWGEGGERWDPAGRLPDFSFVGYALGTHPIPQVPVVANVLDHGARANDDGDDTDAFLGAMAVAQDGAVLVPRGRYILSQVLRFDRPHRVLRGEGSGRTVLHFPRSLRDVLGPAPANRGDDGHWSWGGGFLWLSGEERGDHLADVTSVTERGGHRIEVSTTEGIVIGQIVRIVQYATDGSLLEHLHGQPVDPAPDLVAWADGRLVDFATPVTAVEEGAIVLERPLRVDVRPQWKAAVFSHRPTVFEVGVEHLTLEFDPEPYAGHLVEPGRNGIFFENIAQFWIRDVEILDADSGIVSNGLSRFGTIEHVRLANEHRATRVTGHHGISLEGPQDILVTGFRIESRFVHDLTVDGLACGNVFAQGRGVDLCFDHHTGAPYENLFTDLEAGPGGRLWDSGGPATGWGLHAAARETFWNVRTSGVPQALPSYPQMTLVGVAGFEATAQAGTWIETIDATLLAPQNLYLAQLERRLRRLRE